MVLCLSLRWRRLCVLGMGSPIPLHPSHSSSLLIPCIYASPLHLSFAGCMLLKAHTPPCAACIPPRTSIQSVMFVLMLARLWSFRIYLSHVWSFVYLGPSSIFDSRMSLRNSSSVTSGIFEIQRILGQVVLGVSEGWLQGLPWKVLPISRSLVKDWLVLAVLSSGAGFSQPEFRVAEQRDTGSVWVLDSGQSRVLGVVGSSGLFQAGKFSLSYELEVLNSLLSTVKIHRRTSGNSVSVPINLFASLSISPGVKGMAHGGDWVDIKKNLRRLYELLAINVVDTKEMSEEIKKMAETVSYTSQQVSNNDARIDDNESSLREMHGKMDRIQEDLQRFIEMHQASRVNGEINGEVAEAALPMEEESVVQPRNNRNM